MCIGNEVKSQSRISNLHRSKAKTGFFHFCTLSSIYSIDTKIYYQICWENKTPSIIPLKPTKNTGFFLELPSLDLWDLFFDKLHEETNWDQDVLCCPSVFRPQGNEIINNQQSENQLMVNWCFGILGIPPKYQSLSFSGIQSESKPPGPKAPTQTIS